MSRVDPVASRVDPVAYHTNDGGTTWTNTANIPGADYVQCLIYAWAEYLYAGVGTNGDVFKSNEQFARITQGLMPSEGGETWGATYTFEDVDVAPGPTYRYKLEIVDIFGSSTFHGPVEAASAGGLCFARSVLD